MPQLNEQIDAFALKCKHQRFRFYSVAFAIFALFAMSVIAAAAGETRIEQGVVTSFHSGTTADSIHQRRVYIELNSGATISTRLPRKTFVAKGDRVSVNVKHSYFFGRLSYQFLRVEQ